MHTHRCKECTLMRCDEPDETCSECGEVARQRTQKVMAKGKAFLTRKLGAPIVAGHITCGVNHPAMAAQMAHWLNSLVWQTSKKGFTFWNDVFTELERIEQGGDF